jgi:hypothetical protein
MSVKAKSSYSSKKFLHERINKILNFKIYVIYSHYFRMSYGVMNEISFTKHQYIA